MLKVFVCWTVVHSYKYKDLPTMKVLKGLEPVAGINVKFAHVPTCQFYLLFIVSHQAWYYLWLLCLKEQRAIAQAVGNQSMCLALCCRWDSFVNLLGSLKKKRKYRIRWSTCQADGKVLLSCKLTMPVVLGRESHVGPLGCYGKQQPGIQFSFLSVWHPVREIDIVFM